MSLRIECLTVDCDDPHGLATFWQQALGYERIYEDGSEVALGVPGSDGRGVDLLLLRVPDRKQVKNRLHLDLQPQDRTRPKDQPGTSAPSSVRVSCSA